MVSSNLQQETIKGWAAVEPFKPLIEHTYVPAPLQPNDVEVSITHCGICGSDYHTINADWGPTDYPMIVGHEIVGYVTQVGTDVTHLKVGDRVGVGAQCAACLKPECYACGNGEDIQCPKRSFTYNDKRDIDGSTTYGGYADAIRVQSDYAFLIPESMPSQFVAPLLCAGTTVFNPMQRYKFKAGDKVGVIGIGGLGHLSILFAKALGCEVFGFSRSDSKKEDVQKLGATFINYLDNIDEFKGTLLDFLIVTCDVQPDMFWTFNDWMALNSRIILLNVPKGNVAFPAMSLLSKNISLTGSLIGSIKDVKAMLEFANKHKVYPWIEQFKMHQVNEALDHFKTSKVKYRIVLEN